MKKRIFSFVLAVLLVLSSVSVFAAETTVVELDHGLTEEETAQLNELMFEYYKSVVDAICDLYRLEELTPEMIYSAFIKQLIGTNPDVVEEAVRAATNNLDKNSSYFTQEEFEQYYNHLAPNYCGIGLIASSANGPITVVGFPEGDTPAKKAGIQKGDIIVSIDGESVDGMSSTDAAVLMKGEKGTYVTLGIKRGDSITEYRIVRDEVEQTLVSYEFFDDVIYIHLSAFGENSSEKMKVALDEADKKGVKKVILDLRDNGGGIGEECYKIASLLMPKGKLITKIIYNDEEKNETHYSKADFNSPKYDIAVLVNDGSASCSEMLAGALSDHGLGYLIGVNTLGKSTGQQVIPLNALKGYLKLTVSQYLTPSGNPIPDDGITPNKYIKNKLIPLNSSKDFHEMTFLRKLYKGDSGDDVIACKERLEVLGYYVGDTQNPEFDELLQQVVAKFQSDCELYSYGVLDSATMFELFNRSGEYEVEEDNQLEFAKEYMKNR